MFLIQIEIDLSITDRLIIAVRNLNTNDLPSETSEQNVMLSAYGSDKISTR